MDLKCDPKWTQNGPQTGPKMDPKWTRNGPEMDPKWTSKFDPKCDPKWTQNGPKMDLKMDPKFGTQNGGRSLTHIYNAFGAYDTRYKRGSPDSDTDSVNSREEQLVPAQCSPQVMKHGSQVALDAVSQWGRKAAHFQHLPNQIHSHDLWPSDPHPPCAVTLALLCQFVLSVSC